MASKIKTQKSQEPNFPSAAQFFVKKMSICLFVMIKAL